MGVQLGNILPSKIQTGGVEVDKIMVGGIQIYPNSTPDTTPPSVPGSFLIGAVTTSQYTITAGASTDVDTPPVEYLFYKDNVQQGVWQTSNVYTATGQSAGSKGDWKCKARDSATVPNESGFTSIQEVGTLTVAPVLSFVSKTTSSVSVSYTSPTGRKHFVIQYKKTSDSFWSISDNSETSTSHTINLLEGNTEYEVKVSSTNVNDLLSADSNIITVTTVDDQFEE